MVPQIFTIAGSVIFILLTGAHLWLTFFSDKFLAKDPAVTEGMKHTHPLLTRQLNMWNAWVGFNASHSFGGLILGTFNITLIAVYGSALEQSAALYILNLLFSLGYLAVSLKYWFSRPTIGIALATVCFVIALALHLLN